MTQDELKLVLEALKWCHGGEPCGTAEAIAVVEKALAQPEQDHVKYEFQVSDGTWHPFLDKKHYENTVEDGGWPIRALYTTPPQRKPLTDEEIDAIYTGVRAVHHEIDSYVFARAIEAAHGIKD